MLTRSRAALSIAAVCGLVAFTGCEAEVSTGGKTVNTEEAEKQIGTQFSEQVGDKVTVSCPDDVKAEKGATFECTATDSAGTDIQVVVTQKDDKGNVSFETKQ